MKTTITKRTAAIALIVTFILTGAFTASASKEELEFDRETYGCEATYTYTEKDLNHNNDYCEHDVWEMPEKQIETTGCTEARYDVMTLPASTKVNDTEGTISETYNTFSFIYDLLHNFNFVLVDVLEAIKLFVDVIKDIAFTVQ